MARDSCNGCGMQLNSEDIICPKCDEHRFAKNHGQTLSIDIAHGRQTLAQAETQLDGAIDQAIQEQFGKLKIIVGRGLIREEIGRSLDAAKWQGRIRDYQPERNNQGAYIIQMQLPL